MTTSSKLFLSADGFMVFAAVALGAFGALALSGERWLGAITPIGGIGFLAAWALFVAAAVKA